MSFRQRLPVESEEMTLQLSRVWESIDSAVTIVTPDGRITYANPACATLYGYTIDEFRGLVSRAERKCTGGAEQNCTTERRRICVEIRGA